MKPFTYCSNKCLTCSNDHSKSTSEGTSGDLGETPGSLEGSQRTLERSAVRRQLRASWGASRAFRGNPGGPWSCFLGSRETGQPESRLVSWTDGRTNGVWFADCPSGSACRGSRRGISGPAWRGPCISYMRGPRHFTCRYTAFSMP